MQAGHIDDLVNAHKGELVFVLGNSDSLNELDMSLMSKFTTIGVQRILETYEPNYAFIVDQSVIRDEYERMNDVCDRIPIILYPYHMSSKMRKLYDGPWISSGPMSHNVDREKKTGPIHIPPSGDSGYEATQLAYRMGASTIALAGIDLHWPRGKNTHSYGDGKARGAKLRMPKEKTEAFRQLKQIYKRRGVGLVSVSPWQTPLRTALGYTPLPDLIAKWQNQKSTQSDAQ